MNKLPLFVFVFITFIPLARSQEKTITKELSGEILWEYQKYAINQNPVYMNYTADVRGGSGKYEYSWRTSSKWGKYSSRNTFQFPFDCNTKAGAKCKISCKVRDVRTGRYAIIHLDHLVEICLLQKHNERKKNQTKQ